MTRRFTGPIGKSVEPWQAGAPLLARGRVLVQQCLDRIQRGGLKQFVAQERLLDGSTIRALAMNHGTGAPLIRVWVERPTGEPTFPFSKRDFIIENGWLELTTGIIELDAKLIAYYTGAGDLVCNGSYEHIYGQVRINQDETKCSGLFFLTWPMDEPANRAPALAPSGKLQAAGRAFDRNPAAYSGLMRLAAQGMQAHRDIVLALSTPHFEQVSPLFDGLIRDHKEPNPQTNDPGRLVYWRIKIASSGVAAVRLMWPETLETTAIAIRTCEVRGQPIDSDQRTRLEMTLLSQLFVDPEATPVVLIGQQTHESLIGAEGFAFLDGHPFFSPQPWGTDNEANPRCVLTDIRRRYDLGTSVADPWEMATTLEYVFSFHEDTGAPLANVAKLHQNKWWPRGSAPYFYTSYSGIASRTYTPELCQAFAMSVSGCPSAEDAVVAAFYDSQGVLHKIEQKANVSESQLPAQDSRCLGVNLLEDDPNTTDVQLSYEGVEQSESQWNVCGRLLNSYSFSANSWEKRELDVQAGSTLVVQTEPGSNGKYPDLFNVYGSQLPACWLPENWDSVCQGSSDAEKLQAVVADLEGSYQITYYKHTYYLMDGEERRERLKSFVDRTIVHVARPGPARDAVLCIAAEFTSRDREERWVYKLPDGFKGIYAQQRHAVVQVRQEDEQGNVTWSPIFVDMDPQTIGVTSVFDYLGCYFQFKNFVHEGTWPYETSYLARNYFEQIVLAEGNYYIDEESVVEGFVSLGSKEISLSVEQASDLYFDINEPTTQEPCVDKPQLHLSVSHLGRLVGVVTDGSIINTGEFSSESAHGLFVGWA